ARLALLAGCSSGRPKGAPQLVTPSVTLGAEYGRSATFGSPSDPVCPACPAQPCWEPLGTVLLLLYSILRLIMLFL
ncbi:unnamed protein product, partial [Amoebophrya sp. A25]